MEDFIPTRSAKMKGDAIKNFISVTYEAPKKKLKLKQMSSVDEKLKSPNASSGVRTNSKIDPRREQELEMKRIRYDVIKFGMSGFEKPRAEEAKMALAIKLGAKPPRNRKKNYKELKMERLQQKQRTKKEEHVSGFRKSLTKHKTRKSNMKKQEGILGLYGKVQKGAISAK